MHKSNTIQDAEGMRGMSVCCVILSCGHQSPPVSLLTHAGLEEAAADPLVGANGVGHLLDVCPCDLT